MRRYQRSPGYHPDRKSVERELEIIERTRVWRSGSYCVVFDDCADIVWREKHGGMYVKYCERIFYNNHLVHEDGYLFEEKFAYMVNRHTTAKVDEVREQQELKLSGDDINFDL